MEKNLEEIAAFLRRANKKTYANAAAAKVPAFRPGAEAYHYEELPLDFHDEYFGGIRFIGEEIIEKDGERIWGMNYHGRPLIKELDEIALDKILRQALMQDDPGILPLRGPASFALGNMKYTFVVTGGLDDFIGVEEIRNAGGVAIYRCDVHGGLIEK